MIIDPLIQKAYEAAQKGQNYAFATVVRTQGQGTPRKIGAKMIVFADGTFWGSIGGGLHEKKIITLCLKAIHVHKPVLIHCESFGRKRQPVCGGQFDVYIEPFLTGKTLLICGAGHIALPMSFLGKLLHMEVTIVDERKDWANRQRFPHADNLIVAQPDQALSKCTINDNTYILIMTHDHRYDYRCLRKAVRSSAKYIGVLASKSKRKLFLDRLSKDKVPEVLLNKISIPVGIDIGAQTPEEISISIASEIIKHDNSSMLNSDKFIYKNHGKVPI